MPRRSASTRTRTRKPGSAPTGLTSSAPPSSSSTAAWRSRWPAPSEASSLPRSSRARSRVSRSSSSARAIRRDAARCSSQTAAHRRSATTRRRGSSASSSPERSSRRSPNRRPRSRASSGGHGRMSACRSRTISSRQPGPPECSPSDRPIPTTARSRCRPHRTEPS